MADYRSPLLETNSAVAGPDGSPDAAVAWHYGDPFREQRTAARQVAVVDRSDRFVIAIGGDERLSWLNTISSQDVTSLRDGASGQNLSLDANGRVEHHFALTDLDGTLWIDTDAAGGTDLLSFLQKMVFWAKAEPRDSNDLAMLSVLGPAASSVLPVDATKRAVELPGGGFVRRLPGSVFRDVYDVFVPRVDLLTWWRRLIDAGATPAGSWAYEALRVAAVVPRAGVDTDERTIPHEVGWIGGVDEGGAVHLDKGCYRGQETVARVHNVGKPPRRLVLLHLDGSAEGRPETGDPVTAGARSVGRIGTVVDHYELGPIALALLKRAVPVDTELVAGPCAASIDPASYVDDDRPQAGRLAVERLRGR